MTKVAIKGHANRGKEVIEILEMLGGKNICNYSGNREGLFYFINPDPYNDGEFVDDIIEATATLNPNKYEPFHLDSFLEKFPHKVGDRVKIISTDKIVTITSMDWQNGCEVIYETLFENDCFECFAADELESYKEETMEEKGDKAKAPNLIGEDYYGKRFGYKIPNGYEFDCIENNEIILKPKQLQYPKTYKECCEVLGVNPSFDIKMLEDEESTLYFNFIDLVRCRNAYWKIAGEQMGLGKPWEPDFTNDNEERYGIYTTANKVIKDFCGVGDVNVILTFPTEEMRDKFYENFKEFIENCKELL